MTAPEPVDEDVYAWLARGVAAGYCSPSVCATHDGVPNVGGEGALWDDGEDPCQHVVRLLHPGDTLEP